MDEKKLTQSEAKQQQAVLQGIIDQHLADSQVSRCILNGTQVLFEEMTAAMEDVKNRVSKKLSLVTKMDVPDTTRHRFDHHEDSEYIRVFYWG